MKKRFLVRHRGRIAGLLLLISPLALRAADVTEDLEGFRKKVDEAEAKANPDPRSRRPQLSLQIRTLENLIKRGDYERAVQALQTFGNYGIPSELEPEWTHLSAQVSEELDKGKAGQLEKWAATVDAIVKETRKTCLEAKVSDDLDALLVRCSAVQMQAERGNNVLIERLDHKMQGVTQTLSAWTSYLDYHNAGDGKKANEALRSLATGNSHYPILTTQEIESRFADVADAQTDIRTIAAKVFMDINSPEDLPKALERVQSYSRSPLNQQANSLGGEVTHITAYIDAWKAVLAGDTATAVAQLNRSFGGYEDVQRYYNPIKSQIEARLLKEKARSWTKLAQDPGEPTHNYLGRILDELKARDDYATMLEVMTLANQVDRTATPLASTIDRQAIEQFLAGQRFEKLGDGLAAVTSYRIVIGLPTGKYAPLDKAQEALKGLQIKYPEAFKSYEGVLLEQIRGLSQQLQMLQNRPPGMPYPMNPSYRPQ
ncbi:MAG: hypothetical protein P4L99_00975 [Chthoniobacter sp.]|nr:hypothetical protein [Chthoniobacter sp.]